jgi:uncharacterized protein YjbJ (UPF0337 family)
MTDQHVKGAVSTVKGTAKEVAGKVTGDKTLETKGKVQKVQGKAQDVLGDVEGRGRLPPIVVLAVGAVIVVIVAGVLAGLLRMGRGPG